MSINAKEDKTRTCVIHSMQYVPFKSSCLPLYSCSFAIPLTVRVNTVESRALCFLYRLDSSLFAIARLTATRHLLLANEYHSLIFFHPLSNIIEYPIAPTFDLSSIEKKLRLLENEINYISFFAEISLRRCKIFVEKLQRNDSRYCFRISIEKLFTVVTNRRFE